MTQLQIYGQLRSHWSNAGVTRGLARGLLANGIDLKVIDTSSVMTRDFSTDLYDDVDDLPVGYDENALAALFVGYPIQATTMLRQHKFSIGAFIAESEVLPPAWVRACNECSLIVTPSTELGHCFINSGVHAHRLMTVPHGLDKVYAHALKGQEPVPPVRFLHVCGARDFPDRKGTPQLINAFARVFGNSKSPYYNQGQLTIRTPPSGTIQALIERTGEPQVFYVDAAPAAQGPAAMVQYYQRFHCVVQPSRAEAFGICLVEARALGLPVICTWVMGHKQHAEPSDVVVQRGNSAPITVNGIPEGRAPTVYVKYIVRALLCFMRERKIYTEAAARTSSGYYNRWSWQRVTEPLAARLKGVSG